MKLIEKLGREAGLESDRSYNPDKDTIDSAYQCGFEDGFRKARELAAKACWESSHRHTHSMGRDAYKDASLMIEQLGEEEAE